MTHVVRADKACRNKDRLLLSKDIVEQSECFTVAPFNSHHAEKAKHAKEL